MNLKKELGQNFLVNKSDIINFINFCNITKNDIVLEIGPGNGALSKDIAYRAKKVIGIELDPEAAKEFEKLKITNYELQVENFLDLNLRDLIEKESITKIIGAIPYYISSPIIHRIIEGATKPLADCYLITQKEFAQKVIGNKESAEKYKNDFRRSYFTNLVEKYAEINKGNIVKKESFNPIPKVDSMYFNFSFNNYPINSLEVKNWQKFLHHVFKTPRKKINKRFEKDLLNKLNIDENLRPENLSSSQINDIYNNLNKSL